MPRKKATSKRANNEGSVYKNKRGLWVAQATIGYDENGKQIRKAVSGKTRADAIANLAPYLPKNGARKQLILQDMPLRSHMGIHFYRLRHTFSNTLFEAQENPKVIQMLMGHKKVETTMIYNTATTNKYLQKAVDVFDERYSPSEQPTSAPQPVEKPSVTVSDKNEENNGNEFLQNIAQLLDEYHISSLDELMNAMDGERPKSSK